jgi:hypothetical protein
MRAPTPLEFEKEHSDWMMDFGTEHRTSLGCDPIRACVFWFALGSTFPTPMSRVQNLGSGLFVSLVATRNRQHGTSQEIRVSQLLHTKFCRSSGLTAPSSGWIVLGVTPDSTCQPCERPTSKMSTTCAGNVTQSWSAGTRSKTIAANSGAAMSVTVVRNRGFFPLILKLSKGICGLAMFAPLATGTLTPHPTSIT